MTFKEEIEKEYEQLLSKAEEYDSYFEESTSAFGSRPLGVKPSASKEYWQVRGELELEIPQFMGLLRKAIAEIPESEKKFTTITNTDMDTQNDYIVKNYANDDFESLKGFFSKIKNQIEEGWNGVLSKIVNGQKIQSQLRNLRSDVFSFTGLLDLFIPQELISIEQEVDITLKLRELGLEKIAEEIEGINEEEDNIKKCLSIRTALEQLVVNFCEKNGITPARQFHHNLDLAIAKGMTAKDMQKTISAQYTFISKIIHKEINSDNKNTKYAIYGILRIIDSLIVKPEKK